MGKVCAFFGNDYGHSTPLGLKEKIKREIIRLIQEESVDTFLVGIKGGYEKDAYRIVLSLKEQFPDISVVFVASTVQEMNNNVFPCNDVMLPCGCQVTYKRWCIVERNNWIIEYTDFIIAYNFMQGRAFKFCRKAARKGVKVIELANENPQESGVKQLYLSLCLIS